MRNPRYLHKKVGHGTRLVHWSAQHPGTWNGRLLGSHSVEWSHGWLDGNNLRAAAATNGLEGSRDVTALGNAPGWQLASHALVSSLVLTPQAVVGVPVWPAHASCGSSRERRLSGWEISVEHSRHGDDLPSRGRQYSTLNVQLFEIEIRRMAITTTIYPSALAKTSSFMTCTAQRRRCAVANQLSFSGSYGKSYGSRTPRSVPMNIP